MHSTTIQKITHQQIDARSLAMHRLAVEKIRANPALFKVVQATLDRWLTLESIASSRPYLTEWKHLIDQGMEATLEKAVEDSEWARAMRQCSPFAGILDDKERLSFFTMK